jgi:hypothetical protein
VPGRNGQLPHEIGEEDDGAAESADHREVATFVVRTYLPRQFGDALSHDVRVDENPWLSLCHLSALMYQ